VLNVPEGAALREKDPVMVFTNPGVLREIHPARRTPTKLIRHL